MKQKLLQAMVAALVCASAQAQVNSGSNGSDGAFNPRTNTVINMADHLNGIYQYTSVNISNGVTVTFISNSNNTPVVWLVQSNCVINGLVKVSSEPEPYNYTLPVVQNGGPGGYRGGNTGTAANAGSGLGGGGKTGGHGSFGTVGDIFKNNSFSQGLAGLSYGNTFLLPLLGGSGGGGGPSSVGGGGGGAILIAATGTISINGSVNADGAHGGDPYFCYNSTSYGGSGAGSGGAIRLVASHLTGSGSVSAVGGRIYTYDCSNYYYFLNGAGSGRVRFDVIDSTFGGSIFGSFTQGFQPIIIPIAGQGVQLAVANVGGIPVSANPSGVIAAPDAIISGQQANPIPIVVRCSNLPLNTPITVSVKPANGATVSAVGYNNSGTLASSTATVSINMPRGGGIIYATAATGN